MSTGIGLLDVHPLQIGFPFEPNKLISCLLRLTNNTDDHHLAVRFLPKKQGSFIFEQLGRKLRGIVPPRSTHTYVVTMRQQQLPPVDTDALAMILESCVAPKGIWGVANYFSVEVIEEIGGEVREAQLKQVLLAIAKSRDVLPLEKDSIFEQAREESGSNKLYELTLTGICSNPVGETCTYLQVSWNLI